MQAHHHLKLDREGHPCEGGEDYSYGDCLDTQIAASVGCQPFWGKLSNIQHCGHYHQYNRQISV